MAEDRPEKRGLGRGLSALLADIGPSGEPPAVPTGSQTLPIELIEPNPLQPRRYFEPIALQELSESIRQHGVLQPIIVREMTGTGRYQIVAGERRWRAAQAAQLHRIPAVVKAYSDDDILQIGLLENIQRQDLNAIEEAQAYRQLLERFGHTQEQLSQSLGKSRSHIANTLRLLTLPDDLQIMVRDGLLTAGHARALHGLPDAKELAARVISEGLSVRQVEDLVRKSKEPKSRTPRQDKAKDPDTLALESDISAALGLLVRIDHAPDHGGGQVSIRYRTLHDLDLICAALAHARTSDISL